jgi:hypothetical protein
VAEQNPENIESSFDKLAKIDLLLLQKQYTSAMQEFLELLERLGGPFSWVEERRYFHHGNSLDEATEICQRASNQWLCLLYSDLDFTKISFNTLIGNLHILHAVMMGTYQGNLDNYIIALHAKTQGSYQTQDLLRLVLTWCPNSRVSFNPFEYHHVLPELVTAQAVATLGAMAPVSDVADKARNKAIDFLNSGQPTPENLSKFGLNGMVTAAWMNCSYADHPKKHQVKSYLSAVMDQILDLPNVFSLPTTPKAIQGKPVMLVLLESFSRDHSMYRCYAELLKATQNYFYTVGAGIDHICDEHTSALFNEFVVLKGPVRNVSDYRTNFESLQRTIAQYAPSLVYYPSIGMHPFIAAMANRRLAPIQAMSFGHPATSMSREMDFVLLEECLIGDKSCFSEKPLSLPNDTAGYCFPVNDTRVLPIRNQPEDGVIRIAIPSVATKITAGFIRCLREVEKVARHQVCFVFFTGRASTSYAATVHNIRRELAHAEFHPMLSYSDYIRELNRCHLHAGTFPFGGTNSLIDSLRQGLPILALDGNEAHNRIDAWFVRRVGLPENFICHTEEEYQQRLLALVQNPDELFRWRRYLIEEVDVVKVFTQEGRPEKVGEALSGLLSLNTPLRE